jgi:hypothetical protein
VVSRLACTASGKRANPRITAKPRCVVMKAAELAAFREAAGRGHRSDDAIVVA